MRNKAQIIWLLVLGVLGTGIFLLVTSRASAPQDSRGKIGDGGFLTRDPCGPPCFLGITPGVTKETEAIQILQEEGLYVNCNFGDNESESELSGFYCWNYRVQVTFYHGSDIVGGVGFDPDPSQQLTVEMVIKEFGIPDAVMVSSVWFTWEREPTTSMALVYGDIKANVRLGGQQGDKFTIEPRALVDWVYYSDLTLLTDSEREAHSKLLSPWHGYGEYTDDGS